MAYGCKYLFQLRSANGRKYTIRLLKDGFSGVYTERGLGGSPVLKMERNGNICGSSLEFLAECEVDGEFAELYTLDPAEFMVELADATNNNVLWHGFITPELYSEPYIDPPYDVKVTATDCLGELKAHVWKGMGIVTIETALRACLAVTGMSLNIMSVSEMRIDANARSFLLAYTNLDHLEGETLYKVLDTILATLHATIRQQDGYWMLIRETDASSSLYASSGSAGEATWSQRMSAADPDEQDTISFPVLELGSASVTSLWPVDKLTQTVVPAKRCQKITAPIAYRELPFPDATGYTVATLSLSTAATGNLKILIPCRSLSATGVQTLSGMRVSVVAGGTTYYLTAQSGGKLQTASTSFSVDGGTDSAWHDAEIDIPASVLSSGVTSVTLDWSSQSSGWNLAKIRLASGYDYPDWVEQLYLNNGARGDADDVKIAVSGSDIVSDVYNFHNNSVYTSTGRIGVAEPYSDVISAMGILAFLGRDYALSVALPRLNVTGIINWPKEVTQLPVAVDLDGTVFLVDKWSLVLGADEMTINLLSLPASAIVIDSEVVTIKGDVGNSTVPADSIFPQKYTNVAAAGVSALPVVVTTYDPNPENAFSWKMETTESWITIPSTSYRGSGETGYFGVSQNNTGTPRSGVITITIKVQSGGGQTTTTESYTVTQMDS